MPNYSRKAIYRLWHDQSCKDWKRDEDEVKSAKILIDEAARSPQSEPFYTVENIPLHNEDGFTAISFALPDVLRWYAGKIRELSLDSACKTYLLFIQS